MDLNSFMNWKVTFLLNCNITFENIVNIHGIKFWESENKIFATIKIYQKNIEEAQNVAKERIDKMLEAISAVLKQKISAEIRSIEPIIAEGIQLHAISYINATINVRREFPIDKVKEIEELYDLAQIDDNVKKIVILLSKPHPRTWENLYKIYEVIKKDTSIKGNGWAKEKELDDFKRTANNPNVLGVGDARHGHSTDIGLKNPMSIDKAISLIENIINEWLKYKKKTLNVK